MKIAHLVAAIVLTGSALIGQIQTGRITGTVYDPNKAVVPHATVMVTNRETGIARKVNTNGTGGYVVPALNPGIYDVTAERPGFRTAVQSGVEMQVGKDLLLDFELVLGETTSVVEVNSAVPLAQLRIRQPGPRNDQSSDRGPAAERPRL